MADDAPPPPAGFVPVPQAAPPPGFQAMPDPHQIDERSGAPWQVRIAVGSARTPQDRLATLQKFYPDAQPYDRDNFVYTDPGTKKPTLYNDKGWMPSVGDIASIAPEIGEFAGGTMGAVLAAPPAIVGAPPTGGASMLAVPVGAGLGAAAGREAVELYARRFLGTQDSRDFGQRIGDIGGTVGMNAGGAMAGEAIGRGIGMAAGPIRRALGGQTGAQALRDFAEAGVKPSAGAVTGNRSVQITEKGLSNMPGSASTMQNLARQQSDDVAAGVGRMVEEFSPGVSGATVQQAGEKLKGAAVAATERFNTRQSALYDDAFAKVGADTAVNPQAVAALNAQLKAELARAPASQQAALGKALQLTQSLLDDAAKGGGIPFDTWRRIRTNIGRDIDSPLLAGSTGSQNEGLKRVYAAISDDMTGTATAMGGDAAKALQLADRYTRYQMGQNIPLLQKLGGVEKVEQAYNLAVSGAKDGASTLVKLRRNVTPQEWGEFSGTVLERLGQAAPGARGAAELGGEAADFSVSTFLTNWNKLAPEAREVLFGGRQFAELKPALDQLVRVMGRLKDVERMANPSGTARNLGVGATMGAAGTAALGGDLGTAAAIVGSSTVAPYVTARMMTDPRFVRWLAGAEAFGRSSPNSIASMAGRLGAIAEANPAIRDEVLRFQQQLQRVVPAASGGPSPASGQGR